MRKNADHPLGLVSNSKTCFVVHKFHHVVDVTVTVPLATFVRSALPPLEALGVACEGLFERSEAIWEADVQSTAGTKISLWWKHLTSGGDELGLN